jgi:hypothetical protein
MPCSAFHWMKRVRPTRSETSSGIPSQRLLPARKFRDFAIHPRSSRAVCLWYSRVLHRKMYKNPILEQWCLRELRMP